MPFHQSGLFVLLWKVFQIWQATNSYSVAQERLESRTHLQFQFHDPSINTTTTGTKGLLINTWPQVLVESVVPLGMSPTMYGWRPTSCSRMTRDSNIGLINEQDSLLSCLSWVSSVKHAPESHPPDSARNQGLPFNNNSRLSECRGLSHVDMT